MALPKHAKAARSLEEMGIQPDMGGELAVHMLRRQGVKKIMERFGLKEEDKSSPAPRVSIVGPQNFVGAIGNSAPDMTTRLIKEREGYSATPYWDVNAWRIGYGSDTMTDENGKVSKVTSNSRTNREAAERDLARRVPEFQQKGIIAYVGQEAWDAMSEGARAAVTSLAYNYGSLSELPSLQKAIQSGDNDKIAQAILARGVDNGGINDERRRAEAAMVLGHPVPPGSIPEGVASATDNGVAQLQQQLQQRGFSPGAIDGIAGPKTKAAIKAFQQANGLVADGIVGPKTMAALQGQQRPSTQPQPPVGARQPANILAPPPLIQPQDIRDAFFNPLPPPSPLTPPRPEGGMLGGTPRMPGGPPQLPTAPMPMPGRPAGLSGPPAIPGRAPMPMPGRPAGLNGAPPPVPQSPQTAPPASPSLVRLPSGKMIAPGTYPTKTGHVTISDDGTGKASIKNDYKGFDLMGEAGKKTILGGIIRSKMGEYIPEALTTAASNFVPAAQNAQTAASQAIEGAAPGAGTALQVGANQIRPFGIPVAGLATGLFGNMFGGAPPAVPGPQFQPGMLGRGLPMRQPPMPLTPSPMLRSAPTPSVPRQYIRAPSGRSAASRGETHDRVWLEAKGLL